MKKSLKKKVIGKKRLPQKTTVLVQVQSLPPAPIVPTVSQLAEPMQDGKKLTIPKTWVSDKQILKMVQRTPREHIYTRKGRGGQSFDYVTVSYVTKVLNYTFGWNWDFEVVEQGRESNQVWVKGRLTVRGQDQGQVISKTQFGRADIKFKKDSKDMLDYGNDLKAAASDALKKCASMFGVASDLYGKTEFKEETGKDLTDKPVFVPAIVAPQALRKIELQKGQVIGPEGTATWVCEKCKDPISQQTADYSLRIFKKHLCKEHQK